jgi:UDP-N-acetylmuramyl pentapeptide phosphotransferase/UDP-N-acetylglucosamine-1-phosphate transferase
MELDLIHPELLYPALVSAVVSGVIVQTKDWHGRFTLDLDHGVQKFHAVPTPRIGGLGLFIAIIIAKFSINMETGGLLGLMIIAALPAFMAGLLEDLTKKVGVKERLLATIASGMLAAYLTGYHLTHVDVSGVDNLLATAPVAIAFTAFAVGGVANSINIIDGFNGLAGGVLMICFSIFSLIAWQVGDIAVVNLCIIFILAVAGFMVINFPFGKIFMGDGGAYFMGFMLAWTAVLLPMRNPGVSPWASIVVCAYPIIETIYSMTRRYVTHAGTGNPDSSHLHSLIKRKIIRPRFSTLPQYFRNALVSPLCWIVAVLFAFPALLLFRDTKLLMSSFAGAFIFYVSIYLLIASRE